MATGFTRPGGRVASLGQPSNAKPLGFPWRRCRGDTPALPWRALAWTATEVRGSTCGGSRAGSSPPAAMGGCGPPVLPDPWRIACAPARYRGPALVRDRSEGWRKASDVGNSFIVVQRELIPASERVIAMNSERRGLNSCQPYPGLADVRDLLELGASPAIALLSGTSWVTLCYQSAASCRGVSVAATIIGRRR